MQVRPKCEFPCGEPAPDFTAAGLPGSPGNRASRRAWQANWTRRAICQDGPSGRSEFQPLEVMAHGLAIALAARHRRAAGHYQDEVAARGAADLLHVAHVDEAGAADAQHRLRL